MARKTAESRFEPTFAIESITVDKALQPRVTLNSDAIADYKDVIFNGGELPPLELTEVGDTFLLTDGFHRISAYRKLGILEVPANIRKGTREDAIRAAIGANVTHGLRRSNPDKRRAVEMAFSLMADKKANWTDTYIADMAGVSSMFVGNVRKELFPETKEASERTTPDGKTVTVVGRGRKPSAVTLRDQPDKTEMPEPKPSGNKFGSVGVAVDKLQNRIGAIELVITELRSIFPNDYNLGESLGSNANLAVTFGKLRKRLAAASAELNTIPLPFEVTEDAPNVATPEAPAAPEPKPSRARKPKAEAQAETPEGVSVEVPLGKMEAKAGAVS